MVRGREKSCIFCLSFLCLEVCLLHLSQMRFLHPIFKRQQERRPYRSLTFSFFCTLFCPQTQIFFKKLLLSATKCVTIPSSKIKYAKWSAQERAWAAEGVTLSGVLMGRDCVLIALRRSPLTWVPKVKAAVFGLCTRTVANLSGKRTELYDTFHGLCVFCPFGQSANARSVPHTSGVKRSLALLFLC